MVSVGKNSVKGELRLYTIPDMVNDVGQWQPITQWHHNDVLYDWATIASKLFASGDSDYKIAGMYIEFENVASPGDSVAIPSFDRSGNRSYYDGLSSSGVRDYLRVPLVASTIDITNDELYPGGNRVTFFAQTQGSVGVHGKAFDNANNSKIFGAALAAFPSSGDATADLIFDRAYLPTDEQHVKSASSQVGLSLRVSFL